MLVIGGAQAVNIVISILRIKVLAVLLGPAGVGLLSLYNSLQGMVANTAGLGMGSSGARQIASVKGEERTLSQVRRVLFAAHLVQGGLAMLGVWLLRAPIALWLLGDETHATEIGLIGIAVLLALLSTAQTALLQRLHHQETNQARLQSASASRPSMREVWAVWKPMASLGIAFMLGGLATTATLLLVRSRITQEMGLDAAGQFAAAWGITMTYVGFLLGAMAADYFPRLTEVINDRAAATRMMNDQAQLGLALGGPVLLLLIGLAPWVIRLLYSAEFTPAATLLQWQTVGNVFKLASWALSFAIVAAARSKTYLLMEMSFNIVFLSLIWVLLPTVGLGVTAIAFVIGYLVYFAVANILAHHLHGFRWHAVSLQLLGTHAVLAFVLLALSLAVPVAGAAASVALALVTGLVGLRVVLRKVGPEGRLAARFARSYTLIGWPLERKDER